MISIRFATPDDAAELLDIYRPYVTDTAITFEYEVPSVAEFRERIVNIQKKYPYIVAVQESTIINGYDANPEHDNKLGRIVGYAYAGAFKNRAAYDRAVEMTVYVNKDCQKSGIGRKLYDEMERILKKIDLAEILFQKISKEHPGLNRRPLKAGWPVKGYRTDPKWNLIINVEIETDL